MPTDYSTSCELCDAIIRPGDKCHHGADLVVVCEACAPTWADMREPGFWVDISTGEPIPGDKIEADIAEYLATGGAITDKILQEY